MLLQLIKLIVKQDPRHKMLAGKITAANYGEQISHYKQRKQTSKRNRPETAHGFYSKTMANRSSLNGVAEPRVEENYMQK